MTTINPNAATSANLYSAQKAGMGSGDIGQTKNQFLTLLVTQLQNQDPLNPMDNAAITSQMAQLSTVEGINGLNATLLGLSGQMDVSQSMQAASLIDKSVLVPGEKIKLGGGIATPHGIDIMTPAAKVTATIMDASGKVVRTIEHGAQPVGVMSLQWDGKGDGGAALPDGAYTIAVAAADESGNAVAAQALTHGVVGSLAYTAQGLRMDLGLAGNVALTDLRKIM